MNFKQAAEMECDKLSTTIYNCQAELRHLPRGKLYTREINGHKYYRNEVDGQQHYLRKDDPNIERLKARSITEEVMKNAKDNQNIISMLIDAYKPYDPNTLIAKMPEDYQTVSSDTINALGFVDLRDYTTDEDNESFYEEDLTEVSEDGENRRSKTELAIEQLYKLKGIPVIYETKITLPDGYVFCPDFTTYSEFRHKYMYHEHLGMLDDPDYLARNLNKLSELITFGYFPYHDVLFTCSDAKGRINLQIISELIDAFMR